THPRADLPRPGVPLGGRPGRGDPPGGAARSRAGRAAAPAARHRRDDAPAHHRRPGRRRPRAPAPAGPVRPAPPPPRHHPPPAHAGGARLRAARRGDCPTHSDWAGGGPPIREMGDAARALGHEYLVLTDHSPRLTVARGLTAARLERQLDEVAALNAEYPDL